MKRSIGITLFGWFLIVFSISSCFLFFKTQINMGENFNYFYFSYFLVIFLIGIGILKLKKWARILLFVVLILKALDIFIKSGPYLLREHTRIIGIVDIIGALAVTGFVFWFFNRKSIKEQFIRKEKGSGK